MVENKKLNRIKVVLAEKDKTGRWLAEKVGKSNCTISKWCNNVAQPDLQTLNKAIVLEVNVKDLLNDTKMQTDNRCLSSIYSLPLRYTRHTWMLKLQSPARNRL